MAYGHTYETAEPEDFSPLGDTSFLVMLQKTDKLLKLGNPGGGQMCDSLRFALMSLKDFERKYRLVELFKIPQTTFSLITNLVEFPGYASWASTGGAGHNHVQTEMHAVFTNSITLLANSV
ncbi:unnamed protein product [Protopolystoma xenopodis]|uniref:Uncharacterized protein n=1 Tax=Protopolystoma xenopodis TaxID=117903 RepID=A0A3S4ZDM3_9PLAT|nr:unnamed protein product [Protopolystoma xenopodis]